jgi:hypothetical protein
VIHKKKRLIEQYSEAHTEAALSALVELGSQLEPYHNDIVVIGGLPTYILTKGFFDHCISEDIDLAVKTRMPRKAKLIRETVTSLGYKVVATPSNPWRFSKKMESPVDNKEYVVGLDFMCELGQDFDFSKYDYYNYYPEVQQGLCAMPLSRINLNLAFVFNFEEIEFVLSGNRNERTTFRVVDLVSSLVLKIGRSEPKDYYDIFALTHYKGGPLQAAESFKQSVSSKKISERYQELLKQSIQMISDRFKADLPIGAYFIEEFDKKQKKMS